MLGTLGLLPSRNCPRKTRYSRYSAQEPSSIIGAALRVEIVLALPAVEVVGMDFATDP